MNIKLLALFVPIILRILFYTMTYLFKKNSFVNNVLSWRTLFPLISWWYLLHTIVSSTLNMIRYHLHSVLLSLGSFLCLDLMESFPVPVYTTTIYSLTHCNLASSLTTLIELLFKLL